MSTPLTDAIVAMTTYANEITGKLDTNLPDAVRSLADGYGQGGAPSATAHAIVFELETGPDVTITFYADSSFILDAIRATTPSQWNGVTVESASLDGVMWYAKPSYTWETIFDLQTGFYPNSPEEGGSYCWLQSESFPEIVVGDRYRMTFDGAVYEAVAVANLSSNGYPGIGDPTFTDFPLWYVYMYGAWVGNLEPNTQSTHAVKLEHGTPI